MEDIGLIPATYQELYNNSFNHVNASSGDLMPDSPSFFILFLRRAYLITLPITCISGVVGNFLAFFVFVSKPLRRTSCSWYLAARSFSDGGFLFASFLTWTSDASKLQFFHTDGLCQMIVFMTYVFAFLSVWLTVVVTIENYIRICRPFRVQTFCNVMIARRAIAGLLIMGIIMYHYPFWTSKVFIINSNNTTHYWCSSKKEYGVLLKWLSFLDMLTTFIIPSLIIIVLMIAITFSLIKSLKRQSRLQSGAGRPVRTNGQAVGNNRSSRSNSSPQAKVTRMLFAVSFFFIVLNGPSHVILLIMVIDEFLGSTNGVPSVAEQVQVFFQFIYYVSFAVNLIIYLACGKNFRSQFKEVYFFLCVRRHSPGGHSEMTAMSVVKIEEQDTRNEELTAVVYNGAATEQCQ